jgi:hypothetical protein
MRSPAACQPLEPRRLLSSVFISRSIDKDSGFGPNLSVGSVAVGNVNGDDKLDIVMTSDGGSSVAFLLGTGSGNVSAPSTVYDTGPDPRSPLIVDLNNDNTGDIVVSNASQAKVSVLLNDGDNHFVNKQSFAVGSGPGAIAQGDFNGDFKIDLAVCNAADNTVSILLGKGDGTFQAQTTLPVGKDPSAIVSDDFNGDRIADLAVANFNDGTVSVLVCKGDGSFFKQKVFFAGADPRSLAVGDMNRDGTPDLVSANSAADNVSVLIGNGNGTFKPAAMFDVSPHSSAVVVADFNADNRLDIASLGGFNAEVSLLLGNGKGGFGPAANFRANSSAQFFMTVGDLDAGGPPVLVTANGFDNTIGMLFARGFAKALTPVSPADGAKDITTPKLVWSGTDEFSSRLIVASNRDDLPTDPLSRASIPSAVIDTTTSSLTSTMDINPNLLRGNTTYFWEVQTFRSSPGLFSQIRSFTTANRAPVVNAVPDAAVQVGTTYSANGTFNDDDANDSWKGTVSYGDGSARGKLALHGHRLALSHVYKKAGKFQIVMKVTDTHGATAIDKLFVTVTKTAPAAVAFADWTSPTAGKLGSFTYQFTSSKPSQLFLTPADLTPAAFSFASGSKTQETVEYSVSDTWTVTFNAAVPRLLLDTKFWRGTSSQAPPPTVQYTFNTPFTIRSGLDIAGISGNTLSLPADSGFFDGIIEFDNVKTLSVTTNATGASAQLLTFAMVG